MILFSEYNPDTALSRNIFCVHCRVFFTRFRRAGYTVYNNMKQSVHGAAGGCGKQIRSVCGRLRRKIDRKGEYVVNSSVSSLYKADE